MTDIKKKILTVKDMKDNDEVVKYDGYVSQLVKDYNTSIEKVKENSDESDSVFFDMGKKLLEVQKKISEDNKDDKQAKKIFSAFKTRVSEKIKKNISNVDKVYKVAEFCETETYQKYQNRLPSGWGTLYLLLSLKDDKKELDTAKIDELMLDGTITKDIKRSDLIRKIESIKNPNQVIKKKVIITIEEGVEPTQEQLNELQKYLNRKFKKPKWQITNPEIILPSTDKDQTAPNTSESDTE